MQKTKDPALQIDSIGKIYLYGTHLSCGCVPRFTVKMAREIDGDILRQAVADVLVRFPQFSVGLAQSASRYSYIAVDLEPPVFHNCGGTVREMGTDDTNGYLLCVSYDGKMIRFDFHHALGDGTGFLTFIKSVLFQYLKLLGASVENDGSIRSCESQFHPEEAEDAVAGLSCEPDGEYPRIPAFRIHDAPIEGDPADTVVHIELSLADMHGIAREYQKTPTTFLCPLFSGAIFETYCMDGEPEKPVVAAVPVDLRPYFPSRTTRCFMASAGIPFDPALRDMQFWQVLEIEKELLDIEAQAASLAHATKKTAATICEMLDSDLPLAEKQQAMDRMIEHASSKNTYILTNLGDFSLPECMHGHVLEISSCLPTAHHPFTLSALSYRGKLSISIAQRDPDLAVCKRFVKKLNQFGIPAQITEVYPFHTMRYGE